MVSRPISLTPPLQRTVPAAFLAFPLFYPGLYALRSLMTPDEPNDFRQRLARMVQANTSPDDVILTDIPWAVAWYGDRPAVWLPQRVSETEAIRERAGATHLFLSDAVRVNAEIDPLWTTIYQGRIGPPQWRVELISGPEEPAALFRFLP